MLFLYIRMCTVFAQRGVRDVTVWNGACLVKLNSTKMGLTAGGRLWPEAESWAKQGGRDVEM